MSLAGRYFDGHSARATSVLVFRESDGRIRILGGTVNRAVDPAQITVSSRLARLRRILRLPGGGEVQTDNNDQVDALFPRHNRLEAFVARMESRWTPALASALVILIAVVVFLRIGLPWFAESLAEQIPPALERSMGTQVMAILDRTHLEPSKLSAAQQSMLGKRFQKFVKPLQVSQELQLVFRRGVGPNAFAIPGGTIVLTDEMVELLKSDDEILAVLAHEVGHQSQRHALRGALQSSALIVLVSLVSGDVSTVSGVTATLPTFLMQSGYSRNFEAEADGYALSALALNGISPRVFADVMDRLAKEVPEVGGVLQYASSHPSTLSRSLSARAAGAAFDLAQAGKPANSPREANDRSADDVDEASDDATDSNARESADEGDD